MNGKGVSQDSPTDPVAIPGGAVERFYRPSDAQDVAQVVCEAKDANRPLLLAAGRTRLHWANPAPEISTGLSLVGLSGVDEFEPEEGVLHARAGTKIREIQDLARTEGWELALDPPGESSTLGGTIATAAVGPRAHAFGRVADVVLGLDLVGGDGIESKCGGRVVKNVTGYDLAKLYCGSFGSLAVICGAWLRLRPLPAVRETFIARGGIATSDFEICRAIGRYTTIRALVWSQRPHDGSPEVVIELGGSREGVDHDRRAIARLIEIEAVALAEVDALRDSRAETGSDEIVLRANVLGSNCQRMTHAMLEAGLEVSVDLGIGRIHARGSLEDREALVAIRRQVGSCGGSTAFEMIPDDWRNDIDVFDNQGDEASMAALLKSRFDPSGILNPGRFAGRI
jgi:glycolate oxidase FAD binding subunit